MVSQQNWIQNRYQGRKNQEKWLQLGGNRRNSFLFPQLVLIIEQDQTALSNQRRLKAGYIWYAWKQDDILNTRTICVIRKLHINSSI